MRTKMVDLLLRLNSCNESMEILEHKISGQGVILKSMTSLIKSLEEK